MPSIPKWIANGMEKVFSGMMNPVQVKKTQYLDNDLKWVQFSGDLSSTKFIPGKVIEFRISDTDFRHYTPALYDKSRGICEVLFYLHGYGPGSEWAKNLQIGDQMKLMGPGGKMSYGYDSPLHYFFGDETSLGLCNNLINEALNQNHEYKCLLELDEIHWDWPKLLSLEAKVVGKSTSFPAQYALLSLNEVEGWEKWKTANFYLSGRAKSIQRFRKSLIDRGVNSKQIISFPYWADGKKGL